MNAVIYCRVSSKEQVDGTSLESQELACREYAAKNHMNVARIFIERGESAKYADRTQLLELLAFCRDRANAVSCLLVWKVDRLARNVGDHFTIKATLLKHDIRVVSVTEPIDTKPEGKLLETILAGFAQFDNDIRAARTVQGLRRKREEGLFPGYAPLGYRTVTRGHKKTEPDAPDQPAFRLLQRAWNEFASGQYKKIEILERLTAKGLRTRGGKPLSRQSLDNIFANPFYAGIVRDAQSGEEHVGRHLPMISRETFAKVQVILGKSRVAVPHKSVRPEFPLRAFARCANCESGLTGSFSRGRNGAHPYYHCFHRACDTHGYYSLDAVHKEFRNFLRKESITESKITRLKALIQEIADEWTSNSRTLKARRESEIKRIKEQQQQLIRMKMDQLVNDEDFVVQRTLLESRLMEIEAERESGVIDADAMRANLDQIAAPLSDLDQAWSNVPTQFQRRFQQVLLPYGFVVGGVGTAQKGRILSFFRQWNPLNAVLVPQMGDSWNQLADEIESLATLFAGASSNTKEYKL